MKRYPVLNKNCCAYIEKPLEAPDWKYCNQPASEGESWCKEHRAIVFRPVALRDLSGLATIGK